MEKSNINPSSLGIYFAGLTEKERSIFDRVLAFNATHGLESHVCSDSGSARLIITSDDAIAGIEAESEQTFLIVANQIDAGQKHLQVKRPLLITRVMNALSDAIKKAQTNQSETTTNNKNKTVNEEKIEAAAQSETTAKEAPENTQQAGHHALVIDDSAAIRKQLELELRDAGITADFAESGEEALEKVAEREYDLIFLDIIMPGIDGYETCKQMRASSEYKKTPIIMLSGKTSPLDEVQGVIAGATTYLTKPVKSAMLQETLGRVTKWLDNFSETENKKDSALA